VRGPQNEAEIACYLFDVVLVKMLAEFRVVCAERLFEAENHLRSFLNF